MTTDKHAALRAWVAEQRPQPLGPALAAWVSALLADFDAAVKDRDEAQACARNQLLALNASIDAVKNPVAWAAKMEAERDALKARVQQLEAALRGVIAVADRKTVEFDAARAALGGVQ